MKYLIERYKNAKDWNINQTGGHRWQSVFYDEIDAVLGCRDVVTLRHVAEAASESENTALSGQDTSHKARTERKKKCKWARPEKGDEEGDLINRSC